MSTHVSFFGETSTEAYVHYMEGYDWPVALKLKTSKGDQITLFLQPSYVNKILEALEPYASAKPEESEEKTCGNPSCEDGRREGG